MRKPDYKVLAKLTLIGHEGAGKSAICRRVTDNQYDARYISTIGANFGETFSKDEKIKFEIWDTTAQKRFFSLMKNYLGNSRLVGLVVDLTDINNSLSFFEEYKGAILEIDYPKIEYVVIYTKSDLVDETKLTPEVIDDHRRRISENLDIDLDRIKKHFITSAKSGEGFDTMIQGFADLVIPPLLVAPAFNIKWDYTKNRKHTAPTSSRGFITSIFGSTSSTSTSASAPPPPIEYQF